MVELSFGYSPGDGYGYFDRIRIRGSQKFINDTGELLYITRIGITGMSQTDSKVMNLALYSDGGGGRPLFKLVDVGSQAINNTTELNFVLPQMVPIPDGEAIWVAWHFGGEFAGPYFNGVRNNSNPAAIPTGSSFPEFFSLDFMTTYAFPARIYGETDDPGLNANMDVNSVLAESVHEGNPNLDANSVIAESVHEGRIDRELQINSALVESVQEGYSTLQISSVILEALTAIPPEAYMSTENFPGFGNSDGDPSIPAAKNPISTPLPGLSIKVSRTPQFNTRTDKSASAKEVRSALQDMPEWLYNMSYEFLEDQAVGESSLKIIQGFFLRMRGKYDDWLFKDPDDYIADLASFGPSDGLTTNYYFTRELSGFSEIVGQVDTANSISIYHDKDETRNVPASPGPYTILVTDNANYIEDIGVTLSGSPMTKVVGAPAAGEYSVNEGTGTYTFNSAQQGAEVVISYRYLVDPGDYTIIMPNRLVFDTAPSTGIIRGSFQFFFRCRFEEDSQEYEKFADKLWELQECDFRSLL